MGHVWYGGITPEKSHLVRSGLMRIRFWASLIAGVLVCQFVLWATDIPLGIPGQWTWRRMTAEADLGWNLIGLATAAAFYCGFVSLAAKRLEPARGPSVSVLWLTGLVLMGGSWIWLVEEFAPTPGRLGKSPFVLFYPSSSGYFTMAREMPPGLRLREYEALMRQGDVLHVGTHPPGLVLIYHALMEIGAMPGVAQLLDATQPWTVREAGDVIASHQRRSRPDRPLTAQDRRVMWLATLLVLGSAAVAVVPLYRLLCRHLDRASAFRAAAFWPTLPAVAIFIPKSDVAFAFLGLVIVDVSLTALERQSWTRAMIAGLLVWFGCMMSLAFLPVILLTILLGLRVVPHGADVGRFHWLPWPCLVGGAVGFFGPTLALWQLGQIWMPAVWWLNFQNHARFYDAYERTYWAWLLVNPVEVIFAAGWPLVFVAALTVAGWRKWNAPADRWLILVTVFVWGSLWLSGKNSGEAARLWIVLMPWLVWLAGLALHRIPALKRGWRMHPIDLVLALQLATSALTVGRVSGFDL